MKRLLDLKIIYFIIFITLGGWAFFAYFTMSNQIHNQEIYAKIINLSGKQRMLSQKTTLIAKRYFESKDIKLKVHLKELIDLMKNDHTYIINNLTSQKANYIYLSKERNLDLKVNNYINILNDFYNTEDKSLVPILEETSFSLLPNLNEAVNMFEEESANRTKDLLNRELYILIGTLLTLLLEAIFIVIPSINIASKNEKKLIKLNETLEEQIEKALEENLQKEKLIQQQLHLTQMEEVISNIAHQWRQPLSVISTLASSIKVEKELDILNLDTIENRMTTIIEKSNYLSSIINNFNELFISEDTTEHINLKYILEKILLVSRGIHEINDITVIVNCEENLTLKGNSTKLTQAILNIINNANDVLISNNIENKEIKINIYAKENEIYIEIEDNAGGIDENIIPKIFDLYFTTKHQSQGTGLGLYVAHEFIRNSFNGTIEILNSEHGAKFTIKIPQN